MYTPPVPSNPFASCTASGIILSASTTYSGCDTPDIVVCTGLGVGKIWAACNVGATTVSSSYVASANDSPLVELELKRGKYFQWGENIAWDYNGGALSTDNCTWDRDTQSCTTPTLSAWPTAVTDVTSG